MGNRYLVFFYIRSKSELTKQVDYVKYKLSTTTTCTTKKMWFLLFTDPFKGQQNGSDIHKQNSPENRWFDKGGYDGFKSFFLVVLYFLCYEQKTNEKKSLQLHQIT